MNKKKVKMCRKENNCSLNYLLVELFIYKYYDCQLELVCMVFEQHTLR